MSTRTRLAKKLQKQIPDFNGQPILWSAERMFPAEGWYRSSPHADCYRFSAHFRFHDRENWWSVDCWYTMTECLRKDVTLALDWEDREIVWADANA